MNTRQILALHRVRPAEGEMPKESNCYECKNRREVLGSCHSECVMPSLAMTGSPHGIRKGWFMYPLNYDPVWMTAECGNFAPKDSVSLAGKSHGKPE